MLQVAAAAGAAKAVVNVGGDVVDYFGSYDKDKDAHRQETNARAFSIAQTGGPLGIEAYRFLKARGGAGLVTVVAIPGVTDFPGSSGTIGTWASAPATADAKKKAASLQVRYEGQALPDPGAITGSTVPVNPLTGQPLAPQQANVAGVLVLVALVGVVLWLGRR